MGHLDEASFEAAIAACAKCGGRTFEVSTYLDRTQSLMLADANDDGRWAHDGEKFIDGVYRVQCMNCRTDAFASDDCPRCHAPDALEANIVGAMTRLAVPQRCPSCRGTETSIVGFARATVKVGEGRPSQPTPVTLFGDPGFHVVAVACDSCDWAQVAEGCPLCGNRAPLRARP
jgi:hypothetical protein